MKNIVRSLPAAALACALVLLGSACHTTPRGSQNTYTGTEGSLEIGRIEGNTTLAGRLKIKNPKSRRLEDGRLQVQFDLQNNRDSQTDFAWAVDWFDANGFQIPQSTRHFEPTTINGGGWKTLTITSPTPQATSWRLSVSARNEVQ